MVNSLTNLVLPKNLTSLHQNLPQVLALLGSHLGNRGISSEAVEGLEKGNCPKLTGAKVTAKINESKAIIINRDAFLIRLKKIFVFIKF